MHAQKNCLIEMVLFEFPQHTFWLRNKKIIILLCTLNVYCVFVYRDDAIKPISCNICQKRFKTLPALNGHMRLHGGYNVKKVIKET